MTARWRTWKQENGKEVFPEMKVIIIICLMSCFLLGGCTDGDTGLKEEASGEEETVDVKTEEIKIYEGRYFDEGYYRYVDIPPTESPLIYCEVFISNVTDSSFDFVIYETVMATDESNVLVPESTAVLEEGEPKAYYHGKDFNLSFEFPDAPEVFPKHLVVGGLERMEGKSYINNSIPGHESG